MESVPIINESTSIPVNVFETNTDSTRKLASVQVVESVVKHPNADALELTTILGWQVITRPANGEVPAEAIPGSKVIYCEIDSMLPGNAEWLPEAVKGRVALQTDQTWYRVKTVKLRGEFSQGLIVPITSELLKKLRMTMLTVTTENLEVGENVTAALGIGKYEPALFESLVPGVSRSTFPTNILTKTDESRVESNGKLFNDLKGMPYDITVKCDGTSFTCFIHPETRVFTVCSRNQSLGDPDSIIERELLQSNDDNSNASNSGSVAVVSVAHKFICPYWSIAKKYDLHERLLNYSEYAIQGELCGPSIQKNPLGLKENDLFVFNVIHLPTQTKMSYSEMKQFCATLIPVDETKPNEATVQRLKCVPLVESGATFNYPDTKALFKLAKGKYPGTKNAREGIVIRSADPNKIISFKVIDKEYLQKNDL